MLDILKHEVKFYFKNKQEAIYIYSFFVSVLLLIPFALPVAESQLQGLGVMSLWIALACGIALSAQGLFKRDHEAGLLEQYQMLPIALELIVFAKWLAFFCFIATPMLLALPVAMLLYAIPQTAMLKCAIGLTAGAAGLSILNCLVAALTAGLEKGGAVMGLILLPLSIPLMIFGASYCNDVSAIWQGKLIFMLGFSTFLLPLMCYAGAYGIRHSN